MYQAHANIVGHSLYSGLQPSFSQRIPWPCIHKIEQIRSFTVFLYWCSTEAPFKIEITSPTHSQIDNTSGLLAKCFHFRHLAHCNEKFLFLNFAFHYPKFTILKSFILSGPVSYGISTQALCLIRQHTTY